MVKRKINSLIRIIPNKFILIENIKSLRNYLILKRQAPVEYPPPNTEIHIISPGLNFS